MELEVHLGESITHLVVVTQEMAHFLLQTRAPVFNGDLDGVAQGSLRSDPTEQYASWANTPVSGSFQKGGTRE